MVAGGNLQVSNVTYQQHHRRRRLARGGWREGRCLRQSPASPLGKSGWKTAAARTRSLPAFSLVNRSDRKKQCACVLGRVAQTGLRLAAAQRGGVVVDSCLTSCSALFAYGLNRVFGNCLAPEESMQGGWLYTHCACLSLAFEHEVPVTIG